MKKFLIALIFVITSLAQADEPITIDNRIKTYIYSENEVFRLLVHYGYQSSIEFAEGEKIATISVGDSFAWKITPVGRRLFIKALQDNMHTNMTIITNKHTYQFDLMSKTPDKNIDKELVYVLRFFYPESLDANKNMVEIDDR
jgi:type IV secretion system protein VirB9